MIIYTGVFFDSIGEGKLDKSIQFPHLTHQFRPSIVNKNLLGQTVTVKVIGYGIDENNEGYLVTIEKATAEMLEALSTIEIPHITLSVSNNGRPVDTKNLKFNPCEPIYLTGIYGGFNGKSVDK